VAVLQSKPGTEYNSASLAEQDLFSMTNYYPSNPEIKNVFVPVAKQVILFRTGGGGTGTAQTLSNGQLFIDLRGKTTSSGGAPTPTSSDHATLSNLDYANSGHTGFIASTSEGNLNVNNSNTVTNGVYTTGSYADPSWITSLNASRVINPPSACSAGNAVTGYTGNMYNQTCNAFMRVTGETGVTGNYQFVDNITSTAYKFNGNANASITANATGLYISAPRIYMNATTASIEVW